jgi:hypothetical protein
VPLIIKAKDPAQLPTTRRTELLLRVVAEVVVLGVVSGKGKLVFDFPIVIASAPSTAALAARWVPEDQVQLPLTGPVVALDEDVALSHQVAQRELFASLAEDLVAQGPTPA